MFGMSEEINAVIIGARDGIGSEFVDMIIGNERNHVVATSRDEHWATTPGQSGRVNRLALDICSEASIAVFEARLKAMNYRPNLVLNCSGLLHSEDVQPERTWRGLNKSDITAVFEVNTVGVALLIRSLIPMMPRGQRAVFASLSARVGSIGDNRLGGWYSYRSSKAAQNMLLKCAALEAKRLWPQLIVLALHPGTVDTELSKPFSRRVPEHKLFSAPKSCGYLESVISARTVQDSGEFFAWDGSPIVW